MASITINGRSFSGNNVSIVGGRIIIDGVEQTGDPLSGRVDLIVVTGSIGHLTTDASVECEAVTGNVTAGGSITCTNVGGNVDAGGSVQAGPITGSVDAGGSVRCGPVGGNVEAGGSVRHG